MNRLRHRATRLGFRRIGLAVVIGGLVIAMIPDLAARTSSSTALLNGVDTPVNESKDLVEIGVKYGNAENYGLALNFFQSALKVDAHNTIASYNIASIYQLLNRNSEAEDQYQITLRIDPGYDPPFNLAVLHADSGDTVGAILYYRRAIAADYRDANAHFNLGVLLRQSGQGQEGAEQLRVAASLDPSLANAPAQGVPGNAS